MSPGDPPNTSAQRTLTKADVARVFGVSKRTVTSWVAKGCPVTPQPGRSHLFNEDEVREWRKRALGVGEDPSVAASRDNLARAELARKITLARRNELELAAERGLRDLDLDEQIRAAKTHDDLMEISKEVGALLGSGALSPARGRAIQSLLAEARHNMKEHREASGDDDLERLLLITEEGGELVRLFEGMISDERRESILVTVRAEAELDLIEFPNVDLTRTSQEGASRPEDNEDDSPEGVDYSERPTT